MWGFTAKKSTSLLLTASLLLVVRFTPIFYRKRGKKKTEVLVMKTAEAGRETGDITITMRKLLTLSPDTVGRSVSGELAVILCVAITPGDRRKQRNK